MEILVIFVGPFDWFVGFTGMQENLSLGDAAKRLLTVTCDACVSALDLVSTCGLVARWKSELDVVNSSDDKFLVMMMMMMIERCLNDA